MYSYVITVNYKVLGANRSFSIGVESGAYQNQTIAIAAIKDLVAKYRAARGETITNVVVALVSQTR